MGRHHSGQRADRWKETAAPGGNPNPQPDCQPRHREPDLVIGAKDQAERARAADEARERVVDFARHLADLVHEELRDRLGAGREVVPSVALLGHRLQQRPVASRADSDGRERDLLPSHPIDQP